MGNPANPELPDAPEMKFCMDCGEKILRKAEICPKCGCRQIAAPQRSVPKRRHSFMGVELATVGLIACLGIIGFWIVSWIVDAVSDAVDERGAAPVIRFIILCILGIGGVIKQMTGKH